MSRYSLGCPFVFKIGTCIILTVLQVDWTSKPLVRKEFVLLCHGSGRRTWRMTQMGLLRWAMNNKWLAVRCWTFRIREEGGTTVLVTHRIDFLRQAPRILFVDQGRLAADGVHCELVDHCPEYAEAYHRWEVEEAGQLARSPSPLGLPLPVGVCRWGERSHREEQGDSPHFTRHSGQMGPS